MEISNFISLKEIAQLHQRSSWAIEYKMKNLHKRNNLILIDKYELKERKIENEPRRIYPNICSNCIILQNKLLELITFITVPNKMIEPIEKTEESVVEVKKRKAEEQETNPDLTSKKGSIKLYIVHSFRFKDRRNISKRRK